jgi:hypothetical protein
VNERAVWQTTDLDSTAVHEAGHALARWQVHGTTGAIRHSPLPEKQAGAESEPLPDELVVVRNGENRPREGPYTDAERWRLAQEMQTTVAGAAAEANLWGKEPLTVLDEPEQSTDCACFWGIANALWNDQQLRNQQVEIIVRRASEDVRNYWNVVLRIAAAFEEGDLSAQQVRALIG